MRLNAKNQIDKSINKEYHEGLVFHREIASHLNMNKNISEYIIDRGRDLLTGILEAEESAGTTAPTDYPLNWKEFSTLPTPTQTTLTQSSDFSNLGINTEQMTHIVPSSATSVSDNILKKVNALNSVWKQINKIRVGGSEEGVEITRTFIMLESNPSTTTQILATVPGQNFTSKITSSQFSGYSWYQEAISDNSKLVNIPMQENPFNGGIKIALGYIKGFTAGSLKGAFGVHYNVSSIKDLLDPHVSTTNSKVGYYVWINDDNSNISADPYNLLGNHSYLKESAFSYSALDTELEILYDVIQGSEENTYKLRKVKQKSNSGAIYKLGVYKGDIFEIMVVVSPSSIDDFSNELNNKIDDKFEALLVISFTIILLVSTLLGICVCIYTYKTIRPVKELGKLTEDIKSKYKLEEIRTAVNKMNLFRTKQDV